MKALFDSPEGIMGGLEWKTRREWIAQGRRAYLRMKQAGARDLDEAIRRVPEAAFELIQAFDALGVPLAEDLREWAACYGRTSGGDNR
jgi:hypothetical protein